MRRTMFPLRILLAAAPVFCVSCDEQAVREWVVLGLEHEGRVHLAVSSTLRAPRDASEGQEEVCRALDLYELGRDPWLRGFERAEAKDVTRACEAAEDGSVKIQREATLPDMESIATAMPDAIANFSVRRDANRGTATLRIVHIDAPGPVRENRRWLEDQVEDLSQTVYRFSERQCDLYDYLAGNVDRRGLVMSAVTGPRKIQEILTPAEPALAERFVEATEALGRYDGLEKDADHPPPAIARTTFSAFEHDFCVTLPSEPTQVTGFVKADDAQRENGWCIERLSALEVAFGGVAEASEAGLAPCFSRIFHHGTSDSGHLSRFVFSRTFMD